MKRPSKKRRTAAKPKEGPALFVAHMSHEMRTPLNAIIGLSEALRDEVYGPMNPTQARSLETIRQSGHHLLALVNDLLDLSRIQSGGMRLEEGLVDVKTLVDESVALISEQARQRDQKLEVKVARDVGELRGDARRLKQALLNLLGNATKFAGPEGRVRVAAWLASKKELVIEVWDSGPGVSAADLRRLFKPFATLDQPLTRANQGAGLGLALSKKLIERHGGTLVLQSGPKTGTTLTIRLPR